MGFLEGLEPIGEEVGQPAPRCELWIDAYVSCAVIHKRIHHSALLRPADRRSMNRLMVVIGAEVEGTSEQWKVPVGKRPQYKRIKATTFIPGGG